VSEYTIICLIKGNRRNSFFRAKSRELTSDDPDNHLYLDAIGQSGSSDIQCNFNRRHTETI